MQAAEALAIIGPPAGSKAMRLARLLCDPDRYVRQSSGVALANIGPLPHEAVEATVSALAKGPGRKYNYYAFMVLKNLGPVCMPEFVEGLGSPEARVRAGCAAVLREMGEGARGAVPRLLELVSDEDMAVRKEAFLAAMSLSEEPLPHALRLLRDGSKTARNTVLSLLVTLDPAAHGAVSDVVEALKCEDPKLKVAASRCLGSIAAGEEKAVEALSRELKSSSQEVRRESAAAMGKLGKVAYPAFREVLEDASHPCRLDVVRALGGVSSDHAEAVDILVAALGDGEEDIRLEAAFSLERLGPKAQSAIPSLLERLQDGDRRLRHNVAGALGEIDTTAASVRALRARASDEILSRIRVAAIESLGKIGRAAEPAIPDLIRFTQEYDPSVSTAAARALGMIGVASEPVIDALIPLLRDRTRRIRVRSRDMYRFAQRSLMALGATAVPALKREAVNGTDESRLLAIQALIHLGEKDEKMLLLLRDALASFKSSRSRNHVVSELAKFGADAAVAVPALIEALSDPDPIVRGSATQALGGIGPAAREAVPSLIRRLRGGTGSARFATAITLGQIGSTSHSVIPALEGLLDDDSLKARVAGMWALAQLGKAPPAGIPLLIDALRSDVSLYFTWLYSARALGKVRPVTPAVLSVLVETLARPNFYVRSAAVDSLGEIGKPAKVAAPYLKRLLEMKLLFQTESDIERLRESVAQALERISQE